MCNLGQEITTEDRIDSVIIRRYERVVLGQRCVNGILVIDLGMQLAEELELDK